MGKCVRKLERSKNSNTFSVAAGVKIRPVESKSLKVGKSLKIGNQTFWQFIKEVSYWDMGPKMEPFCQSGILFIYNCLHFDLGSKFV